MIKNNAVYTTNKDLFKDDNLEVIDINKRVIENIRSLIEMLENENIPDETRDEINKTIRTYLQEMRKIHVLLPF